MQRSWHLLLIWRMNQEVDPSKKPRWVWNVTYVCASCMTLFRNICNGVHWLEAPLHFIWFFLIIMSLWQVLFFFLFFFFFFYRMFYLYKFAFFSHCEDEMYFQSLWVFDNLGLVYCFSDRDIAGEDWKLWRTDGSCSRREGGWGCWRAAELRGCCFLSI